MAFQQGAITFVGLTSLVGSIMVSAYANWIVVADFKRSDNTAPRRLLLRDDLTDHEFSSICSETRRRLMFKSLVTLVFMMLAMNANAATVRWELTGFQFSDGGTAHGSFLFNTDTNQFSQIDIYTTGGSMLTGRHYVATAGAWGSMPQYGVLAFSDTTSTNFTGAGWFRIDARIDVDAKPGTILDQWLAVGGESFCMNANCSSAANDITNPGQRRNTVSGQLVAVSPVPLPASAWLFGSALLGMFGIGRARRGRS